MITASSARLRDEIQGLLEALRHTAEGRYACVMEPRRIVFEASGSGADEAPQTTGGERSGIHSREASGGSGGCDAAPPSSIEDLRGLLQERGEELFAIPRQLASGEAMEDVFERWEADEFFLAFINGRVAVVVACPRAEPLREMAMRPLRALADRLFRYDQSYRLDEKGRGFFFGRPRLDLVVVGRQAEG